jgi:hypothetical protein
MITAFLTANMLEFICGGTFLTGFSVFAYFKTRNTKTNKFKVQYCDVTPIIKQYKRLQKTLNDGMSTSKNDKFFS